MRSMSRNVLVMGMVLAACGAEVPQQDAGPDPDAEPGPCTLPTLSQTVATLAGCSEPGTADGPRNTGRFNNPTNAVIAPSGITYITDFDSHRVRAIDPAGTLTTVFQAENFKVPFGIALAPGGKLYVETDDNDLLEHNLETGTLWLIDPATKTGEVLARNLGRPRGLAVLSDGRIAMADHMHDVVTIFDPVTKIESPLAGALDTRGYANGVGTDARFAQPYDIVVMPDGSLVVSDYDNHRLRRVLLDGTVSDFAGSGDIGGLNGPVAVATFDAPQALAVLPTGVVFVSDVKRKVIRRIASDMVTTIAGDGTPGWLDAMEPRNARFYGVEGMDVDAARLVIADGNIGDGMTYHHVRVIQLTSL
jgi:DNA-binding beta-propeller fold protein YncE